MVLSLNWKELIQLFPIISKSARLIRSTTNGNKKYILVLSETRFPKKRPKYSVTQKNGKFWKTQQKLKKSKKKKLLTEIEPLQLAF